MKLRNNRLSGKPHGYATGKDGYGHLYAIWSAMRNRCMSPKNKCYKNYGARGIKIYEEWDYYPVFREWALANGYKDGLTLDRKDSNGNYTPENCRWLPMSTNVKRRKVNRYYIYGDNAYTLRSLCKKLDLGYSAMWSRMKRNGEYKELQRLSRMRKVNIHRITLEEVEQKRLEVA